MPVAILVDNFSGTPQEGKGLKIRLDYTGSPTTDDPVYVGWAPPGKATSDPIWKIMKFTFSGTNIVSRDWADGDTKFDNVWDDRAALAYS